MDGAALNGHTVKRLYMEFLIKHLGDIRNWSTVTQSNGCIWSFLSNIWEIYGNGQRSHGQTVVYGVSYQTSGRYTEIYGTFTAAVRKKTLENEKPVANQMPGFVGAGSWDLSFRVE
jgi:hypothetical protein